jgi:HK97 gp10 family phage protein
MAARVEAEVAVAVDETLTAIEQNIKDPSSGTAAPYRTGALRRSYHRVKTGMLSGRVGNDAGIAPYAVFLEYGTARMPAQPHLIPSAERERGPFRAKVAAAVRGSLRGTGFGNHVSAKGRRP